jgi:hypothetical protein
MQWLLDPSEINGKTGTKYVMDVSRHFWNKKRDYLKDKSNELATNRKNKNIRDMYRGII